MTDLNLPDRIADLLRNDPACVGRVTVRTINAIASECERTITEALATLSKPEPAEVGEAVAAWLEHKAREYPSTDWANQLRAMAFLIREEYAAHPVPSGGTLVDLLAKAVSDIAAALIMAGKKDKIQVWTAPYVEAINAHDAKAEIAGAAAIERIDCKEVAIDHGREVRVIFKDNRQAFALFNELQFRALSTATGDEGGE